MLRIERANSFKKDYKLALKRGKKLPNLEFVISALANQEELPAKYRDHKLTGNFVGCWECHVEPDYLLIYKYEGDKLVLARLGTHSDLFKK